uniref:Fe2OG dioxygenase domain-containing protein n=2 Tax=Chromera velia TaxID=505693 RepID=A0A0G4HY71_9ALVE|eukprot:Cvel_9426.t1-p1 / transcript=Cvel_9426.t1 / gene=Cvel_9426 / organism=Chromera_velia_CCMP2878 / gene_product=Phytanoyl-CoA dioxygenase domain-containing protein, putative / transcript_product=Phytanoyl-CoA dioxygenase domain-containing protein, putative / location=Cvel_scaffold543:25637-26578(+) / protein_length=314 / sequence_SO=supercontig / SO=protein_coding / is_pseudo=false
MSEVAKFFEENGYAVVKGFCSPEECAAMRGRMSALIDAWDGKCRATFGTGEDGRAQDKSSYFLDSADKIHFFLENEAVDPETGNLKDFLTKHGSLNKVGHGLHVADDVFRAYATSEKVVNLTRELGYQSPVLPQSMYIFKNAKVGGEVTPHQDSTYLYTEPRPSCLGLWLALHDATTENGCLWARPGSHKEAVRKIWTRNPEHFEAGKADASLMVYEHLSTPKTDMEGAMEDKSFETSGKDPKEYGFVPVPINAGDLFIIHGQLEHMSLPNRSEKPRETFQLHLVEGPKAGVFWSKKNWLQYPGEKAFPSVGAS